jgi:HPr Serine kinase C-terminal domain
MSVCEERRYRAYGLTILSSVPLDLAAGRGEPDVVVRRESLDHVGPPRYLDGGSAFAGGTPDRLAVRFPDMFAGEVRNGREIAVDAVDAVPSGAVGDFVLQPLLGYLMVQRGYLVLHASCVDVAGRAVAILGASGDGKSTTAGALVKRGHRLLCDDVVAIDAEGRVVPGVARLKLWPAAATALGHDPDALERCAGESVKRLHRPEAVRAEGAPVPLHRAYVLNEGVQPAVEPVGPGEALPLVIRNSYGIFAIRDTGGSEHFARVTDLLARGLVRRLRRPRDLDELDALSRTIEADVAEPREPGRPTGQR